MAYHGVSKRLLQKAGAEVGDEIVIERKGGAAHKGILMPRTELGDERYIIIKIESGYNLGVRIDAGDTVKMAGTKKKSVGAYKKRVASFDKSKPTMSILHTGGTIASRIDYRTGGVFSAFTPDELLELFPELEKVTNLRAKMISNMFSEDIEMDHIAMVAENIKKEIDDGVNGIVITHGTDTMHISSAALSFMAQNLPIPIIFVGSQRSSDRGSSDAQMNLMCASQFAVKADFAGVGLCMHASMSDDDCFVHEGTKAKKVHTSRRDTFRSINQVPWARVWPDGRINFIRDDYARRDPKREPVIRPKFEKKVALIKSYSGFHPELISFLTEKKFKGVVLEGTGLGHVPTNVLDNYTKHHAETLKNLREYNESGGVAVMASACMYGRINMNVYSTGRDILAAGVVPGADMMSEVALVKLKWVLGQTRDQDEAKKMMLTNIAGEITERTTADVYINQFMK